MKPLPCLLLTNASLEQRNPPCLETLHLPYKKILLLNNASSLVSNPLCFDTVLIVICFLFIIYVYQCILVRWEAWTEKAGGGATVALEPPSPKNSSKICLKPDNKSPCSWFLAYLAPSKRFSSHNLYMLRGTCWKVEMVGFRLKKTR